MSDVCVLVLMKILANAGYDVVNGHGIRAKFLEACAARMNHVPKWHLTFMSARTGSTRAKTGKKRRTSAEIDRAEKGFTVAGSHDGYQVH